MYVYNKTNISSSSTTILSTAALKFVQQQQFQILSSNPTDSSISTPPPPPECQYFKNKSLYIVFCLMNVIVIQINVMFCLDVYKRRQLHKLVLFVNLSTTGIVISLFAPFIVPIPDQSLGLIDIQHAYNAIWSFAVVAHFTTITAIAFERYLVINRRSFHKKHSTPCKMGCVVLLIWFYSLVLVVFIAFCYKQVKNVERYVWSKHYALYYTFIGIQLFLSFLIILILHCLIRPRIKWMRECARSSEGETTSLIKDGDREREKAFTNSIMIVAIILFALWIIILVFIAFYSKCFITMVYLVNIILPINFFFFNPNLYSCVHKVKNRLSYWSVKSIGQSKVADIGLKDEPGQSYSTRTER